MKKYEYLIMNDDSDLELRIRLEKLSPDWEIIGFTKDKYYFYVLIRKQIE